MDVSVVITCWNGRKLLEKNLPKVIRAAAEPRNKMKEIIVVDDYSSDDSVAFLKKEYPQVRLIEQKANFGYSVTCNTGVQEAKDELVVILNADVAPVADFLEKTWPHFEDEKVFAVTFNEGKYGPGKLVWKDGFLEIEAAPAATETCSTDWPNGGSSIFRKSLWQKLGGMDKLFLPFYFEDVDLGRRATKAGFQCLWEPMAKVNHQHEATISEENFKLAYLRAIKQRNHLLLTWRNIDSFSLFFLHLKGLAGKCLKHPGYLRILLLALWRWLTNGLTK